MDTDTNLRVLESNNCAGLGINTSLPKYPRYAVRTKREESYKNWPTYIPTKPSDLVEAGLVYTG